MDNSRNNETAKKGSFSGTVSARWLDLMVVSVVLWEEWQDCDGGQAGNRATDREAEQKDPTPWWVSEDQTRSGGFRKPLRNRNLRIQEQDSEKETDTANLHTALHGLRPYHPEHARSRLISEAKQGRAWLALGWETVWEYQVL
ncbi:hypothetical protein CRENBAI_010283 [Crenichthys baileyi]|uniref:Uncharacterized protein n=1 Tax=Crenichthys baileyi TaxID=28760 RepID=A0AAV9RD44_9TELE